MEKWTILHECWHEEPDDVDEGETVVVLTMTNPNHPTTVFYADVKKGPDLKDLIKKTFKKDK